MKSFATIIRYSFLMIIVLIAVAGTGFAQQEWEEGELEDVEIEIIKERQIILPRANRNFEKIPPRPSEAIKTPMQYDFRPFSFQSSQANPAIRPLKLKQEDPSKVYGGYFSAGYGNYASPYLEGFINTKRNKNKLVGVHAYHNSSGKGPVDDRNSASGASGLSVFGRSFSDQISLSGDFKFDNRSTHFYGYSPGSDVEANDIHQSYNVFKLSGALSNARSTDFAYKLGGAFSYLTDKFEAAETEVNLGFQSSYDLKDESIIAVRADYAAISRKDALVEAKPRSLFSVNPTYVFYPVEGLRFSAGVVAAFENDSIDNKDVHAYPDLRASYPLSPSVNAIASFSGGIEKVSLQSLSNENIWLAPNIPVFHTNKLYDFQVGLYTRIGNKVSFNGGLSIASLKNWYFFKNTAADRAKFEPLYDRGSTERVNFFASLGFAPTESVKILLRGDVYSYSTDDEVEAWHRPTYKVTADATFNIYRKVLLDIDLIAQGGMMAQDYEVVSPTFGEVELDAALDLNARLEYMVSDSFSIFGQFNNIMDNQYPVFLHYPVRGFQVSGGVTWSF